MKSLGLVLSLLWTALPAVGADSSYIGMAAGGARIEALMVPGGPGVRFDTLLYAGCTIPPFYDSLLGKLIVWDEDRASAIKRLKRALRELRIEGVQTTKPLHLALACDADVLAGLFDGWD